jgi:hypothetical protein
MISPRPFPAPLSKNEDRLYKRKMMLYNRSELAICKQCFIIAAATLQCTALDARKCFPEDFSSTAFKTEVKQLSRNNDGLGAESRGSIPSGVKRLLSNPQRPRRFGGLPNLQGIKGPWGKAGHSPLSCGDVQESVEQHLHVFMVW